MENKTPNITESKKRLSLWRLFLSVLVLAGLIRGGFFGWHKMVEAVKTNKVKPWFAPYVDVTANPSFGFEQPEVYSAQKNQILAFIVSLKTDNCTPSWGGVYSLDDAGSKLDLDRRIARYTGQGGNIAVSFGGLLNDELAVGCKNEENLAKAYQSVISRYGIDTVDFDLEGEDLKDTESLKRRAKVISQLQKTQRSAGKKLAVWLTLPVSTQGLTTEGTNAVSEMLTAGVDLAGVNAMTMDFGQSLEKGQSIQDASVKAINETHRQLDVLYKKANINLNDTSLWTKIGVTPMVGQNDVASEIFTIDDAKGLNEFVTSKGVARMSMWSANRDVQCGENYVNTSVVSDSCSGVKQDRFAFSGSLSEGFSGSITFNASNETREDPKTEQKPDNPEESPYQIWTEKGTYLQGTKVVWHHNVYEAKWWTSGDLPDNPVLQAWQTPWQLVGPVLPGEKPIPQPTLPAGTYPEWSGTAIYETGQRVLFNGVPYLAKWWTQGDSPAASSSNPNASPWVILTQKELDEVIKNPKG